MKPTLAQIHASNTWNEIHAQPQIWRDWANEFDLHETRRWVDKLGVEEVWFCGAGTSGYIGDIVATGLPVSGHPRFRSIPSTDLVARPGYYLDTPPKGLLIVNFGRSGNSSETLGTLEAVYALAPSMPMLNITCNPMGALAKSAMGRNIVLPESCHDVGFAMTSSFSTMLLTALAIFDSSANATDNFRQLADLAEAALPNLAHDISSRELPSRVVFVGSGPLAFAARESALKVMELSAGEIPALWDSTLGFRHGPKSFVSKGTAIYVLLSADTGARPYDIDLVEELITQFPEARTVTIGAGGDLDTSSIGSPAWDAGLSVLPAQLAAVIWSAQLGLNIDDPFVGKSTLSRVVADVRLHPVEGA
jgi:tagatose-6-phosphate ketose/aldose isomerase